MKENYLCYSGGPKLSGLYLRKDYSRARKNTINVFEFLNNQEISKISIVENERIIQTTFAHYVMNIILFGGAKSNIVITDSKGTIIDSFKNKKNLLNKSLQIHKSELKGIDNFQSHALNMKNECLKTKEYYILDNAEEERLLSLIPLKTFPIVFRKYNSISDAIKDTKEP